MNSSGHGINCGLKSSEWSLKPHLGCCRLGRKNTESSVLSNLLPGVCSLGANFCRVPLCLESPKLLCHPCSSDHTSVYPGWIYNHKRITVYTSCNFYHFDGQLWQRSFLCIVVRLTTPRNRSGFLSPQVKAAALSRHPVYCLKFQEICTHHWMMSTALTVDTEFHCTCSTVLTASGSTPGYSLRFGGSLLLTGWIKVILLKAPMTGAYEQESFLMPF